ncbi:MAG: hypothetical protein ACXVEF_06625 [Polyangiales bacterium]
MQKRRVLLLFFSSAMAVVPVAGCGSTDEGVPSAHDGAALNFDGSSSDSSTDAGDASDTMEDAGE